MTFDEWWGTQPYKKFSVKDAARLGWEMAFVQGQLKVTNDDLRSPEYVPEGPRAIQVSVADFLRIAGKTPDILGIPTIWAEWPAQDPLRSLDKSTNAAPQVSPRSSEGESTTADREPAEAAYVPNEATAKNAARYLWLKAQFEGADFDYDDMGSVLVFDWPAGGRVSADLDSTIDSVRGISPETTK